MDTTQIIILLSAFAIVAFRLYQKYGKKKKSDSGTKSENISDPAVSSHSKDEDYEPYSKR
jgi:hypothetical protein